MMVFGAIDLIDEYIVAHIALKATGWNPNLQRLVSASVTTLDGSFTQGSMFPAFQERNAKRQFGHSCRCLEFERITMSTTREQQSDG